MDPQTLNKLLAGEEVSETEKRQETPEVAFSYNTPVASFEPPSSEEVTFPYKTPVASVEPPSSEEVTFSYKTPAPPVTMETPVIPNDTPAVPVVISTPEEIAPLVFLTSTSVCPDATKKNDVNDGATKTPDSTEAEEDSEDDAYDPDEEDSYDPDEDDAYDPEEDDSYDPEEDEFPNDPDESSEESGDSSSEDDDDDDDDEYYVQSTYDDADMERIVSQFDNCNLVNTDGVIALVSGILTRHNDNEHECARYAKKVQNAFGPHAARLYDAEADITGAECIGEVQEICDSISDNVARLNAISRELDGLPRREYTTFFAEQARRRNAEKNRNYVCYAIGYAALMFFSASCGAAGIMSLNQ